MSNKLSLGSVPLKFKLNKTVILNSFLGFAIALIFDDMKGLIINEIILRIINQKVRKKYIKIDSIGVIFDYKKIIDLSVNILLSLFFIWILYTNS
jgi:hypothetical protein